MDWWTNELTKRATFFFKEKTTVHIKLKDKYAYNGLIKEVAENEFIIVQDRLFGEITLFLKDILTIDIYIRSKDTSNIR